MRLQPSGYQQLEPTLLRLSPNPAEGLKETIRIQVSTSERGSFSPQPTEARAFELERDAAGKLTGINIQLVHPSTLTPQSTVLGPQAFDVIHGRPMTAHLKVVGIESGITPPNKHGWFVPPTGADLREKVLNHVFRQDPWHYISGSNLVEALQKQGTKLFDDMPPGQSPLEHVIHKLQRLGELPPEKK
jgi:hypothetical protein